MGASAHYDEEELYMYVGNFVAAPSNASRNVQKKIILYEVLNLNIASFSFALFQRQKSRAKKYLLPLSKASFLKHCDWLSFFFWTLLVLINLHIVIS